MKTCGTCKHTEVNPQDMTYVICYGVPATPVLMPVRVGNTMDMQVTPTRCSFKRTERACSLHESVVLLAGNDGDAIS